jgi:leucyl-tRNA synthetase
MHQTIKKVSADIESLKMNTAIAQLMTLVNAMYDNGGATKAEFETLVQLLNPFAPHMTEELWEKLGHSHDEQLAYYPWPAYEEAKCVETAGRKPYRHPPLPAGRGNPTDIGSTDRHLVCR